MFVNKPHKERYYGVLRPNVVLESCNSFKWIHWWWNTEVMWEIQMFTFPKWGEKTPVCRSEPGSCCSVKETHHVLCIEVWNMKPSEARRFLTIRKRKQEHKLLRFSQQRAANQLMLLKKDICLKSVNYSTFFVTVALLLPGNAVASRDCHEKSSCVVESNRE